MNYYRVNKLSLINNNNLNEVIFVESYINFIWFQMIKLNNICQYLSITNSS